MKGPFSLPNSWEWGTVGEVVSRIEAGKSFTCHPRPARDDEWGIIKVSAMTWGEFREQENKAVPADRDIDPRHEIRPGDILVSRANTEQYVGAPVLVRNCRPKLLLSDKSLRLVPAPGIYTNWLLAALASPFVRRQISARSSGQQDSMRNISQSVLMAIELPIPPLAEQRRIVAALEDQLLRLDSASRSISRAAERQSFFVRSVNTFAVQGPNLGERRGGQLFAEQLEQRRLEVWSLARPLSDYRSPASPDTSLLPPCPPGWTVMSLEAITDPIRVIRYGILKPRVGSGGVVPYVEVKDLAGASLRGKSLHVTSKELDEEFAGARVQPGDIVMAVRGSYERSAVVPAELPFANLSRDVARIAPLAGVDAEYLHTYLQSSFAQNYFRRHARGVAVKGVNISTLRQLPVVLPPPARQAEAIEVVATQLAAAERLFASIKFAEQRGKALRASLLAQAFAGRLVPQDPNDEPASELLARIRAERQAALPKQKARSPRTRKDLAAPPTRVTGDDYRQETLPL